MDIWGCTCWLIPRELAPQRTAPGTLEVTSFPVVLAPLLPLTATLLFPALASASTPRLRETSTQAAIFPEIFRRPGFIVIVPI